MKKERSTEQAFEQFSNWIQEDMSKDRLVMNKKILNVVFWCLILPSVLTVLLFAIRKFQFFALDRYFDYIVFFPPFVYVIVSIWPTLREIPRAFKRGGLSAHLEEAKREVNWRENCVHRMKDSLLFNPNEWRNIYFHLKNEIERAKEQNRYMTVLSGSVLFLMFQFLDLGATESASPVVESPAQLVELWVTQFSQWGVQFFSLILFVALFYLSGAQFQRVLSRYLVSVEKIVKDLE